MSKTAGKGGRAVERRLFAEERRASEQAGNAMESGARADVLAAILAIRQVRDGLDAERQAIREELQRLRASRQCSRAYVRAGTLG